MISPEAPSTAHSLEAFDRRRVISGLGLASLGYLASSVVASAGSSTPKVSVPTRSREISRPLPAESDLGGIPADWVRIQGSALPEYARYLNGLKLKSISPTQVIEAHAKKKGNVWNTLPPKQWWTRMGYTLRVADRVAQEMGVKEVEIISAYRCPVYNAHCEGAKVGSWHQANVALDVKFPVRSSKVTATARNLRDRGLFKGGVGGYWDFTHIDTRGQNMNW